MYSGLKNLSSVLFAISIIYGSIAISLVVSIFSNYKYFNSSDKTIATACVFLIVTAQIILISFVILIKKLLILLIYKETVIIERIAELEEEH